MDYDPSDSSGTDDDLPPTHQNRGARGGHVTGNGRAAVLGGLSYNRPPADMETQIHQLEQEAYSSVLRAFKAQSDAISWEKESLITELRKELRVTDDEHRVLLSRVNADDIIRRIREWRQAGGGQPRFINNAQPVHEPIPSPTVSASRKKQKTAQPTLSLPLGGQSSGLHSQTVATPVQPSSSKRGGPPLGSKGKKPKPANGPPEATNFDPLIGRKVLTRWPEDNNFYEAVITDYNPKEGLHALVYDMNTKDETWEWVNLKEISPDDIRWEGEDPGISRRSGRGSMKKPVPRTGIVPNSGRGRGVPVKGHQSQNGIGKRGCEDIEILHTDTLIKEVEKIFASNHPDPVDIEKAKKLLKEHEQSLIDAIARLADASDGESADEHRFPPHGQQQQQQPLDRKRVWPSANRKFQEGGNGGAADRDHATAGGGGAAAGIDSYV